MLLGSKIFPRDQKLMSTHTRVYIYVCVYVKYIYIYCSQPCTRKLPFFGAVRLLADSSWILSALKDSMWQLSQRRLPAAVMLWTATCNLTSGSERVPLRPSKWTFPNQCMIYCDKLRVWQWSNVELRWIKKSRMSSFLTHFRGPMRIVQTGLPQ